MGTMGLALPWEHRIPPVPRDRERRVEPFREPAIPTGIDPAAEAAKAEDSALAAACQSGDLRAYERLYALQGARMKNLARNLLGNPLDAEDAVQDTFLEGAAQHRQFSRPIQFRHLDLSHPGQHVPRCSPQAHAQERSSQ